MNTKRKEAELEPIAPIVLHECRHTFASLMIAAGVNAKALSTYMGHSSITITLDRYGHLMPGNEAEAACLLDSYLEMAPPRSRRAEVPRKGCPSVSHSNIVKPPFATPLTADRSARQGGSADMSDLGAARESVVKR